MAASSQEGPGAKPIDIVAKYHSILSASPDLSKPVAAIVSIIELLKSVPFTTAHETLDLVKTHTRILRDNVRNPIPLSAGADLFHQYLLASLQEDLAFDIVRQRLLDNGPIFAQRAMEQRNGVAEVGWRRIRQTRTGVLTHGTSRTVLALLRKIAAAGPLPAEFRVVYVRESVRDQAREEECDRYVQQIRKQQIPVLEISMAQLGPLLGDKNYVDTVLLGAEVVTQSGGIISRSGTHSIAQLVKAKRPNRRVFVAAESHKLSRTFMINEKDGGLNSQVELKFSVDKPSQIPTDIVDFTSPDLIDELITEDGFRPTSWVITQLLSTYHSLEETWISQT